MSFTSVPVDLRPYKRWAAITPSDSTVYDPPFDALYLPANNIGSASLVGADDVSVNFGLAVPAGILPLSVKKVMNTGTSLSTGLIGLYRD